MEIDKLTHPEVKKLFKKKIAIVPIGATEQHGPHLPMGTDSFYAEHIAKKVGEKLQLAVLPVVSYSVSGFNFPYPTITIEPETLKSYLNDICASLKHFGVNKILFFVGHGGENCSAVESASYSIARDLDVKIKIIYPWQNLSKENYELMSSDWHAGFLETSEMLYLKPHLVQKNKIKESSIPDFMDFIQNYKNMEKDKRNGVFGNPIGSNAEVGKKNMEQIINKLVETLTSLLERK